MAPTNKVHHVFTIARVAAILGEDEDWLGDVANEMDQEDGLIWVYGPGEDGVMGFTDFGIETLRELVEIYKADPDREVKNLLFLKKKKQKDFCSLCSGPGAIEATIGYLEAFSTVCQNK